uniref:Uncharacterized protein n=1 Tax=Musa acuminata subsp. malaccensis TaxID=214687 RepID=A0A804IRY8_MUSAM
MHKRIPSHLSKRGERGKRMISWKFCTYFVYVIYFSFQIKKIKFVGKKK